jgi:SpoVK/Ycf46/Vps4 family AAA+-type ATPase
MNALTDGHTSEHSDTKHTAMQLWTLLDKYQKNKDFLFIGTTNVTKKMPHQLQTRLRGSIFSIDLPSLQARQNSLKFYIQNKGLQLDATCTNQYLQELARKIENFSQRDIEILIRTARLLARGDSDIQPIKISKQILEQAYADFQNETEKHLNLSESTTDEERRHQESIALQKKGIVLHKKGLTLSKQQFATSQKTQICLAFLHIGAQAILQGRIPIPLPLLT